MEEEFELTYLPKALPRGLLDADSKEIFDIYIPASAEHAVLRLRKRGYKYEITKKVLADGADASHQVEHTIPLTKEEFNALAEGQGKRLRKIRYYIENGRTFEIDVFQDALEGLVLVDVEFKSNDEKSAFTPPDWLLADITQEKFIAGGMLAGKSYADIEEHLAQFGYQKIN